MTSSGFSANAGGMSTWGTGANEPSIRETPSRHTTPHQLRERHLREVRELAYLLDNSLRIPVINYRFGVDAILGLVPVLGDFSAFALGSWIIYRAARMGAPARLLARMLFNSLGDAVLGSIPILGTVVDVIWKANSQNLRLLERFLAEQR